MGRTQKKPKTPKPAPAPVANEEASAFDRQTAASVLSSVDILRCKTPSVPRGEGHIVLKFTPASSAMEAVVDKGPLTGTPTAKCIANEFNKAKIPAFKGEVVREVGKSFRFE